jgi:hypothetical protein
VGHGGAANLPTSLSALTIPQAYQLAHTSVKVFVFPSLKYRVGKRRGSFNFDKFFQYSECQVRILIPKSLLQQRVDYSKTLIIIKVSYNTVTISHEKEATFWRISVITSAMIKSVGHARSRSSFQPCLDKFWVPDALMGLPISTGRS